MAAHQAPLSMGFSRQEYWSGVPLPSPQGSLGEGISGMRLLIFRKSWSTGTTGNFHQWFKLSLAPEWVIFRKILWSCWEKLTYAIYQGLSDYAAQENNSGFYFSFVFEISRERSSLFSSHLITLVAWIPGIVAPGFLIPLIPGRVEKERMVLSCRKQFGIHRAMIGLSLSGTVPSYSCWCRVTIDSALLQSQNFPSLDTKVYGWWWLSR